MIADMRAAIFRSERLGRQTICGLTTYNNWGGWIRTTDLLINSQALCQLSYTPSPGRPGASYNLPDCA